MALLRVVAVQILLSSSGVMALLRLMSWLAAAAVAALLGQGEEPLLSSRVRV